MATVPISIELEEAYFIPVMKVLHHLNGVAKIDFNLDDLGKKRGGKVGPRHTNGADPLKVKATNKNAGRIGLRPLLYKALYERPHQQAELKQLASDNQYRHSSLSQALNDSRRAGEIATNGKGEWSLTKAMRAKIEATFGEAHEVKALPAPEDDGRRKKKDGVTMPMVILAVLRRVDGGRMRRLDLKPHVAAKGFSDAGLDGGIWKAKDMGWIRPGKEPGEIKITPKGMKVDIPSAAFPDNEGVTHG